MPLLLEEDRIMFDANNIKLHIASDLSPATLRARARRRRETAERLWDERLEQLLLEEADELEGRAAALEVETAIRVQETNTANRIVQPDLAALREEP
ncbi:MAG TPA: hypothetical protein VG328_19120 [Stellaceae bacterium]|nr:hypothetical protein [Stellaceae bacterium]